MGGARNGRFLRLGLVLVLGVFTVYVVYLYHSTKTELGAVERQVEEMTKIHEKLTNELKDSIQNHARVERELRTERDQHSESKNEKIRVEKRCSDDMRVLRETNVNQMSALHQEKEHYKTLAESHEASYQGLAKQHQQMTDECNEQINAATGRYQQLQDSCQTSQRQLNEKVHDLEQQVAVVRSDKQQAQQQVQQCTAQVNELKAQADTNQMKLRTAEARYRNELAQNDRLEEQVITLEEQNRQLQSRAASEERQVKNVTPVPPVLRQGNTSSPAFGDVQVSDVKKREIYDSLREKVTRGEHLSDKQLQIFQLLNKHFSHSVAEEKDKAQFMNPARRQSGPNQGQANVPDVPGRPGLNSPDTFERGQFPHTQLGQSRESLPAVQQLGHSPAGMESRQHTGGMEQGHQPINTGIEGGQQRQQPPRTGIETQKDWIRERHQNPLEEQEEVKDLREDLHKDGEQEEDAAQQEQDQFENLGDREEEEEEEGGAQQAFVPQEIDPQREQGREADDAQDHHDGDREAGRDEEPGGAKVDAPLPQPHGVVNTHEQNGGDRNKNHDGRDRDLGDHVGGNMEQVYRDFQKEWDRNEDHDDERNLGQEQNLDQQYDDYDKDYKDEDEDDQDDDNKDEYYFDDDDDGDGNQQLAKDLEEQHQRILKRRDVEGLGGRGRNEEDAHRKGEERLSEVARRHKLDEVR